MAPYQSNKPEATDQKNVSQGDIQGNFAAIKTLIDVNHETFDDPNEGKHKYVTFPQQGVDPNLIETNQATIYSKISAVTGKTGLFWQNEGDGFVAGDITEMTAFNAVGNNGYTMLPSGLKINFGRGTINSGNQAGAPIVFSSAFTTTCYACTFGLLGIQSNNDGADWIVYAADLTQDGFTPTRIRTNYHGSNVSFSYIAIGK